LAKKGFIDMLKNNSIKKFINFSSIFSFIVGNIIIFFALSAFIDYTSFTRICSDWIKVIIGIVGLFISFLLIKTHYFIKTKKEKKKKSEELKEVADFSGDIKIGFWNTTIILIRLLFFNIMNDLFIVLVSWLVIFSSTFALGLISIPLEQFNVLMALISVIGIISGIFQFYIQSYKEKISQQVIGSITKSMTKFVKTYSFNDFLIFTKDSKSSIYNDITTNLKDDKLRQMLSVFRDLRSGRGVTNITFNVNAGNDALLAQSLEFSDINKKKLVTAYENYFEARSKDIEKDIKKMDLNDIRKTLLPNIIFFDEAVAQIISSEYTMEEIEDPHSYIEFLNNYAQKNVMFFIEKLLKMD
jgi:hypothetical protein